MPTIIDYDTVLEQMRRRGFRCNYYNSGAFAFADPAGVRHVGWVGPEDPSIRPAARAFARQVAPPYEENLSRLLARVWHEHLPGPVWVMPMSHWSFELDHGSREWMPAALRELGLDPEVLAPRTNAAAIEFSLREVGEFTGFVKALLGNLAQSDFSCAFVQWPVVCAVHHHKQIWWSTTDEGAAGVLEGVGARSG